MVMNKKEKNKGFLRPNFLIKNRKGWVKVLEVFVSILLIMGVVFFTLNKGYVRKNLSDEISEMELSILRKIQTNDTLREIVLNAEIPSNFTDFNSSELLEIKNLVDESKLSNLNCQTKICSLEDICKTDEDVDKEIYAESAVVSANLNIYNPRQLKLFCWEK